MGYRSEVASVIYAKKDIMDKFKADNTDRLKELEIAFESNNDEGLMYVSNSDYDLIFLKGNSWKWYDTYTDVKAWHDLMDLADKSGLVAEFLRIGEEYEDIEHEFFGNPEDIQYYLQAERFIEANF